MITFFTTCKNFVDLDKVHQYNAIRSWRKIYPDAEILIFGKEKGIQEIARKVKGRCISDLNYGKGTALAGGTPYISEMFIRAQKEASFNWLCFINADIITTSTLKKAIQKVQTCCKYRRWGNCLMVGQRWDVTLNEKIQFDKPDWEDRLILFVVKNGRHHFHRGIGRGIDYFVFRKGGMWDEMPKFLVNRMWWDTYLPWYVSSVKKLPVLDATDFAFVVHPFHPDTKLPKNEVAKNQQLGEGHFMYCWDTPWIVTKEKCFER